MTLSKLNLSEPQPIYQQSEDNSTCTNAAHDTLAYMAIMNAQWLAVLTCWPDLSSNSRLVINFSPQQEATLSLG